MLAFVDKGVQVKLQAKLRVSPGGSWCKFNSGLLPRHFLEVELCLRIVMRRWAVPHRHPLSFCYHLRGCVSVSVCGVRVHVCRSNMHAKARAHTTQTHRRTDAHTTLSCSICQPPPAIAEASEMEGPSRGRCPPRKGGRGKQCKIPAARTAPTTPMSCSLLCVCVVCVCVCVCVCARARLLVWTRLYLAGRRAGGRGCACGRAG